MFRLLVRSALPAVLVLLGTVAVADTQAEDVRAIVEQLFGVGWDTSVAARDALDDAVENLSPAARVEPRIRYAQALALIKQGRQREAKQIADELVSTYRESTTPLKAKVWLAVLLEQHAQAMADMETLATLASRAAKPGEAKEGQLTAARTMGLLFGYLEGPLGDRVSDTTRGHHAKSIQERLTPELRDAFRDGQRDVLVTYLDLKKEYEQKEAEAKQEAERRRVEELQRIEVERKQLVEQHEQLKAEISRMRDELQSDLDALAAAESPLLQEQARAEQRRLLAANELVGILDELDILEDRLAREQDPVIRSRLRREIRRLEVIADDLHLEVLDAERQIAATQNEIAGLRRERARLQANMDARLKRADREYRNLTQREKRLTAETKALRKPILDVRPLLPLQRKMESLATYAPFPLEQEKSRLLDSL